MTPTTKAITGLLGQLEHAVQACRLDYTGIQILEGQHMVDQELPDESPHRANTEGRRQNLMQMATDRPHPFAGDGDWCGECDHSRDSHPGAVVSARRYVISVLPEDWEQVMGDYGLRNPRRYWEIVVEWAGPMDGQTDRWKVHDGVFCFDRDGNLSAHKDEGLGKAHNRVWLARRRFTLDEALALAKRLAPDFGPGRLADGTVASPARAELQKYYSPGKPIGATTPLVDQLAGPPGELEI